MLSQILTKISQITDPQKNCKTNMVLRMQESGGPWAEDNGAIFIISHLGNKVCRNAKKILRENSDPQAVLAFDLPTLIIKLDGGSLSKVEKKSKIYKIISSFIT